MNVEATVLEKVCISADITTGRIDVAVLVVGSLEDVFEGISFFEYIKINSIIYLT